MSGRTSHSDPARDGRLLGDEKERTADTHSREADSQMPLASECRPALDYVLCALVTGYFRKSRIIGAEYRSVGARAGEWKERRSLKGPGERGGGDRMVLYRDFSGESTIFCLCQSLQMCILGIPPSSRKKRESRIGRQASQTISHAGFSSARCVALGEELPFSEPQFPLRTSSRSVWSRIPKASSVIPRSTCWAPKFRDLIL